MAIVLSEAIPVLRRFVRVMAKRYQQAVGPWRAYLRILPPA
jgi:hypothetical protein